jgi:hypothetical protein
LLLFLHERRIYDPNSMQVPRVGAGRAGGSRTVAKEMLRNKLLAALVAVLLLAPAANAIPHLQIYIEGATYDASLESWVTSASNFKLWVVGNVSQDGAIYDVKLSAALYGSGGSISIAPTTTSLLTDPSTPIAPTDEGGDTLKWMSGSIDYSPAFTPVLHHDEFANADAYQFWRIGDMMSMDSPIGDFQTSFPTEFPNMGQINVYDISVSGWDRVHFDAFDHTVTTLENGKELTKWWFAPPSHDGTGGGVIPEPGTLALLGLGLAGLGAKLRRKKN